MRKLFWLRIATVSVPQLGLFAYLATATSVPTPFGLVVNNTHTNSSSSSSSNSTTQRLSVELPTIGYDGTWEQFCDPKEMEEDYQNYPKHELKKIRELLCELDKQNKMDRAALAALAAYKYCIVMRPRIDEFLFELVKNFAQHDAKKEEQLLAQGSVDYNTTCYHNSLLKFSKTCVEEQNPYFRMFKPLIARACEAFWLSANDLREHMERICAHRLVAANIHWEPILESISYKLE